MAAIALLQTLFPGRAEAKLVRIDPDSYTWDVDFSCPKRQEQHVQKMHSKMLRPKYVGSLHPSLDESGIPNTHSRVRNDLTRQCLPCDRRLITYHW